MQHGAGVVRGEQRLGELVEPLVADHLGVEVRRAQHGHRRERRADELELLLLDGVPGAEVALGELVREDPVHDHGVGQVPVQVQVGERPHRLGDDHPVRRHHEPHRHARGVAQQLVHRDEVADEPLHLGDDLLVRAAGRRGTCARAGAPPRASTARGRAPCPATSAPRPGTRAAAASRRSARSRRRSRPSRSDSAWPLSTSSENSSSPPGGTVSSSAAIRSTPRSISSAAEPVRDRAPVLLELVLGLHLLGVQAARRPWSARRRPAACRTSASECAGSVETTSVRAPAAAQRRAVAAATDVLPTPPLPV